MDVMKRLTIKEKKKIDTRLKEEQILEVSY
jgi:hypothetical protein